MFVVTLVSLIAIANTLTIDLPTSWDGTPQSVKVTGQLHCNGMPTEKVKIKLYEKEIFLDVLMDEQFTDENGNFTVKGTKSEYTWIEPKINIYHKCNYDGLCYRRFSAKIPKEFISQDTYAHHTFDIGSINLDNMFSGESTDCIN